LVQNFELFSDLMHIICMRFQWKTYGRSVLKKINPTLNAKKPV